MPGKRWSSRERDALRRQHAVGVSPQAIRLPARSGHAVRTQLRRLGLVRCTRVLRRWQPDEIAALKFLAANGYSAGRMVLADYFGPRSTDSVAQKMRRLRLGDPARSKRQRNATRLTGTALARFHTFLRAHARDTPTQAIAPRFGVSRGTVKRHLRQLGIVVTWRDAMAMPQTRTRIRRLARERNLRRWAMWRDLQERRLRVLAQKFRGMNINLGRRVCDTCQRNWYASEEFFKPRPKRRERRIVATYLSRTCRICLAERARRQRGQRIAQ